MSIIMSLLELCFYILFGIFLYNLVLKLSDPKGENKFIDTIELKIKKCYEYFRQRICKKGDKVDADGRPIQDGPEFYDSSSVWED